MAHFVRESTGQIQPLHESTIVGSLAGREWLIPDPRVSRTHAVIDWRGDGWTLHHQGTNPTWINGTQLSKGETRRLAADDVVSFGVMEERWRFAVAERPCAFGRRLSDQQLAWGEAGCLALPDAETPIWTAIRDETGGWSQPGVGEVSDRVVDVDGSAWQVVLPSERRTGIISPFNLFASRMEIITYGMAIFEVRLHCGGETRDFEQKAANELLYILARQFQADREMGLDEDTCGWVTQSDIAKQYRRTTNNIYVWSFHLRQRALAAGISNGGDIIQSRANGGEIRLGVAEFEIIKR